MVLLFLSAAQGVRLVRQNDGPQEILPLTSFAPSEEFMSVAMPLFMMQGGCGGSSGGGGGGPSDEMEMNTGEPTRRKRMRRKDASSGKGAVPPANAAASSSSSSSGTVRRVAEENPHGPEEEPAREDKRSKYYLITWTRTDVAGRKQPAELTHQDFYREVKDAYKAVFSEVDVLHDGPEWAFVAREFHANSPIEQMRDAHYHMAAAFKREHRWLELERHLREVRGIKVHFSAHTCYRTAYEYLTKPTRKKPVEEIDQNPYAAPGHPREEDIPQPAPHLQAAWQARTQAAAAQREDAATRTSRANRMEREEVYDIVANPFNNIRKVRDLWRLAEQRKNLNDRRLHNFLLNCKDLGQLFGKIQESLRAPEETRRESLTRLQILEEARLTECQCPKGTTWDKQSCPAGTWKRLAIEVVDSNGYRSCEVEQDILEALEGGRGKMRNIWFYGGQNRAKTFLLQGLGAVYRHYEPPDTGSYQLEDLDGCEIILLNEFEWSSAFCPWPKFKELLEGKKIKIGVAKNRGQNYMFDDDAPLFGSSRERISHPDKPAETVQADARVKYREFTVHYDPVKAPRLPECPRCVAEWLLEARDFLARGVARSAPPAGTPVSASSGSTGSVPPPNAAGSTSAEGGSGLPQPGVYRIRAFCGDCGDPRGTSPFCTVTGRPH